MYYVVDERHPSWNVVARTKPRDVFDVCDGDDYDSDADVDCDGIVGEFDDVGANVVVEWAREDIEGLTLYN